MPMIKLASVLKIVFLVLLSYFCFQFFVLNWQTLQVSTRLANLSIKWIAAAVVFTGIYHVCAFLIWFMILRNLGSSPMVAMALKAYIYALLPKYVPGKILSHGIKAQLSINAGVPLATAVTSILLEFLFAIASSAMISVPGLLFYYPAALGNISVAVTIGIFLSTLLVVGIVTARKFQAIPTPAKGMHLDAYLKVILAFIPLWLAFAFSHWCVAHALSAQREFMLFPLITAVSASWILGVVSVFTPAGLGVREAALYFFMSPWMNHQDAILLATLSRLILFGVEILLTVGCWIYFWFEYGNGGVGIRKASTRIG